MSKHNIECVMHALPSGLPPVNVAYSRNPEGLQLRLDYLLYKAEKLSLRPSVRTFWSSGAQPSVLGSTSNLLEMKRLSSGMMKFIFKSFRSLSFRHRRAIKTTRFNVFENYFT